MYYLLLVSAYLSALLLPAPAFLAIVLVIALRFRGYGCLFVAALVDIQFLMVTPGIPLYTMLTVVLMVMAELVRPRLRLEVAV